MLRKLIIGAIVLNFVFILFGFITTTDKGIRPSFAANTTIIIPGSAHVEGVLQLINAGVKKIPADATDDNPWHFDNTTDGLNFGNLTYLSDQGYYIGEFWYCTLMVPVTSGRPYKVEETGTAFTGAAGTFPETAILQIPDYQYLDMLVGNSTQGAMPTGAALGAPSSAVGTHVVYNDPVGRSRILRGIITIGGPLVGETLPVNFAQGHNGVTGVGTKQSYGAWQPADQDTPPGDYSGSVTYTLTLL